jgi:hypothetical protein
MTTTNWINADVINAALDLATRRRDVADILSEPTYEEALAVWENVTGNGMRPANQYNWGAAASAWPDLMFGGSGEQSEH